MPSESQLQSFLLIGLILMLALVGVIVIVGLGWTWRQTNRRQKKRPRKRPGAGYVDAWSESGKRLPHEDDAEDPP